MSVVLAHMYKQGAKTGKPGKLRPREFEKLSKSQGKLREI